MIIGMTGKARSGKNTAADMYVEALDGDVEVFGFADPLKEMALEGNPIVFFAPEPDGSLRLLRLADVVEDIGWERAKDEYPEVRRHLQWLGTNVVRRVRETYWVDQGIERARAARAAGKHVIITDIRFPNEAEAVWSQAGMVVKTVRPGLGGGENGGHSSETSIDLIEEDVTLLNDGSLDDLRAKVLDSLT